MNSNRDSDERIVPLSPVNKGSSELLAESAEERRSPKENSPLSNLTRAQDRNQLRPNGLERVREAARKSRDLKFTSLLHHVDETMLQWSFSKLRRTAATGVDEVTWQEYEVDLRTRIASLHDRIHRGAYRAKPSKRVYIEKSDGSRRPLGIPSLEDKIVQYAVREVLNCIYETDFVGFSYGFRRGRNAHQALDALAVGITDKRVNWVLDADIQGFFDAIDRDWLIKFLEHRIGDKRMLRLIRKWLNAGIIEDTNWSDSGYGTPQGSVISPLLANVFLHYALDLWVQQWREGHSQGSCIVVRYADDFVLGFESEVDARSCHQALIERLAKFGLKLHPDKTRLIEFGRGSMAKRQREGRGKCETFDFLGFTHICGKTFKHKRFILNRITIAKRMRRTLAAIKEQLERRRHDPLGKTGRWLAQVYRGWQGYYGVPNNGRRLQQFRNAIFHLWLRQIRRRSQKGSKWTWARMGRLMRIHLPKPRILHPWPHARFHARSKGGAV